MLLENERGRFFIVWKNEPGLFIEESKTAGFRQVEHIFNAIRSCIHRYMHRNVAAIFPVAEAAMLIGSKHRQALSVSRKKAQ